MKRVCLSLSALFLLAGCLAWVVAVTAGVLLLLDIRTMSSIMTFWWMVLAPAFFAASLALHLGGDRN